ncbi:CHAT domain-containing protein [Dactylonectria estremocensis]|uniref:CHAT domain-containing protein n=1 Tax=Dactylonectria estremocensis TaxID=1079267 RepID=A0A9P9EKG7_9HYPO|nr:CHAT domain-containing protein [Dactylonectria estremocensis]
MDDPDLWKLSSAIAAGIRMTKTEAGRDAVVGNGGYCIEDMARKLVKGANEARQTGNGTLDLGRVAEAMIKRSQALVKEEKKKGCATRPNTAPAEFCLVASIHARYILSGDIKYLDQEMQHLARFLAGTKSPRDRLSVRQQWSKVHEERAKRTWETKDLNQALAQALIYLDLCRSSEARSKAMQASARLLELRFDMAGASYDLEQAAEYLQRAAGEVVGRHDKWIQPNYSRSAVLMTLWEATRSLDALRAAKAASDETAQTAKRAELHDVVPRLLLSAGRARKMLLYYDRCQGTIEDAISCLREAHALLKALRNPRSKTRMGEADSAELEWALTLELAACFMYKFNLVSACRTDVDNALGLYTQIPARVGRSEWAMCRSARYDHFGAVRDLEEAARDAMRSTRGSRPWEMDFGRRMLLAGHLLSQGHWGSQRKPSYWLLARRRRVRTCRFKAPDRGGVALTAAPSKPIRPLSKSIVNLIRGISTLSMDVTTQFRSALRRQVQRQGRRIPWHSRRCLSTALFLCKAAVRAPGPNAARLMATLLAGQIYGACGAWEQAVGEFGEIFDLLQCLNLMFLDGLDRHRVLDRVASACGIAARSMLMARRDPMAAVKIIAGGRDMVVNSLWDTGGNDTLQKLEATDTPLFREYGTLQRKMVAMAAERPRYKGAPAPTPRAPVPQHKLGLSVLVAEAGRVQRRIRELPGFEHFHRQHTDADLLAAAKEGPIVCFELGVGGGSGGHWFIVTKRGVRSGELTGLTPKMAAKYARHVGERKFIVGLDGAGSREWEHELSVMLRALGKCVLLPLEEEYYRERAGRKDGDPLPRVWWHMSGAFGLLPLHAAGPLQFPCEAVDGAKVKGKGKASKLRRVMSLAVSSYIPSISHMVEARRRRRKTSLPAKDKRKVLVVLTLWGTTGYRSLDVAGLAETARAILSGARWAAPTVLINPCREVVLEALSGVHFALFACHAVSDPADPMHGGLLLPHAGGKTERITMRDINAAVDGDVARLACVFACSNNQVPRARPADECSHVAAGLHVAGFQEVAATLYPVDDHVANRVFARFFKKVVEAENVGSYARLFHSVVAGVRRETGLADWSSFIHVGV